MHSARKFKRAECKRKKKIVGTIQNFHVAKGYKNILRAEDIIPKDLIIIIHKIGTAFELINRCIHKIVLYVSNMYKVCTINYTSTANNRQENILIDKPLIIFFLCNLMAWFFFLKKILVGSIYERGFILLLYSYYSVC